ncbi:teneurin-2, partial [Tachysurus ichikawai]
RPLPPTPSSSLLPPAPPPPPSGPHPSSAPSFRECQMPLLDSGSPHAMLEPHAEDEFSPNSYLLRAQASNIAAAAAAAGKKPR